ncbi:MAG: hypothetical protein K6G45_12260 [Lachnospiraceae bacterium]|nr:hypothetical protein [Lachnospiraceae bacterium]
MSKSKTMLRVLCVVLSLVMALSVGGVKAQAADEKPSKYLSSSTLDVNKVLIGLTEAQFNRKMEQDTPAVSEWEGNDSYLLKDIITFSESGYFTYKVYIKGFSGQVGLCNDAAGTKAYIKESTKDVQRSYPVDAEGTVFVNAYFEGNEFSWAGTGGSIHTWYNFVPMSQMVKIDRCEETDNGFAFYIKEVADNIETMSVVALEGDVTAREAYEKKDDTDYRSLTTESGEKVNVPKKGTYTLVITVYTDDKSTMEFVQVVRTQDYVKETVVAKPDKPISLLAGTNVVVGKATPGATVYVKVGKKEYNGKADNTGYYRIITSTLKEGKKVSIWQKIGKKSSKKISEKVVGKY